MNDAINHYRTYLNDAAKKNATGLPHNLWAMLMTLDRMVSMEREQTASNWQSQVRLAEKVKRLEKGDEA
jgi:hypothetical protein